MTLLVCRSLGVRVTSLQAALEQRTADWQIAEVARQQLQRTAARRSEQGAAHVAEVGVAQVRAVP